MTGAAISVSKIPFALTSVWPSFKKIFSDNKQEASFMWQVTLSIELARHGLLFEPISLVCILIRIKKKKKNFNKDFKNKYISLVLPILVHFIEQNHSLCNEVAAILSLS